MDILSVMLAMSMAGNSGGDSDGTINYTDLTNKPKINGVELSGNNSAAELGLAVGTDGIADKAVSDEDGNSIKDTYATKESLNAAFTGVSQGVTSAVSGLETKIENTFLKKTEEQYISDLNNVLGAAKSYSASFGSRIAAIESALNISPTQEEENHEI